MSSREPSEVTRLLVDWSQGHAEALEQLVPLVYHELRKLAASLLRSERTDHTLQPTALIHEAYLRLVDQEMPSWQSRAHFFGVASRLMRQILVDHARRRDAGRRGGSAQKVLFEDALVFTDDQTQELLALDDALEKLEEFDERKCRIIEMRSFGGMSIEETAAAIGFSIPTVKREIRLAKAWLLRELKA